MTFSFTVSNERNEMNVNKQMLCQPYLDSFITGYLNVD